MQSHATSAAARPAPETSLKAILRLAWPLFLANLAIVGNGTIDAVMAGRLSAADMAGVAVAASVYVTVYIGFMAVLQALSPIAGHHFGAQRWRQIGDDVQQALGLLSLAHHACHLAWVAGVRVQPGGEEIAGERRAEGAEQGGFAGLAAADTPAVDLGQVLPLP